MTPAPDNEQRRDSDTILHVLDTHGNLTDEDVKSLKEMASYWSAGKMLIAVIIGLGFLAVGMVHIWDFLARLKK
jgi:hypothetical protein